MLQAELAAVRVAQGVALARHREQQRARRDRWLEREAAGARVTALSGVRNIIHRMGGNGSGPAFPRPPDPCGLRLIMPSYVQRSSSERAGG